MPKKIKLEGERLAWFELASHLHTPVEVLKEHITYGEFLEWQEFFRIKNERTEKEHFYLAQIASEVCKTRVKYPNQVKLRSFLLQSSRAAAAADSDPAYKAHRLALSKGAWMFGCGLLANKKEAAQKNNRRKRKGKK